MGRLALLLTLEDLDRTSQLFLGLAFPLLQLVLQPFQLSRALLQSRLHRYCCNSVVIVVGGRRRRSENLNVTVIINW